jgi:hypothetical protein
MKNFQATDTLGTAGVPVTTVDVASTDRGGVQIIANTANPTQSVVGLTVGLAGQTITIADTGMTDNADLYVRCVVNPDAVYRAKLSGGATAGTALTEHTNTSEDTTGVTCTGAAFLDDGVVWGYSGNNVGQYRRADAATTVATNFINTIAVGDSFLSGPGFPGAVQVTTQAWMNLTTNMDQVNAAAVDSDNDNFLIVDFNLRDSSESGTTNSFYHLLCNNHAVGGNLQMT